MWRAVAGVGVGVGVGSVRCAIVTRCETVALAVQPSSLHAAAPTTVANVSYCPSSGGTAPLRSCAVMRCLTMRCLTSPQWLLSLNTVLTVAQHSAHCRYPSSSGHCHCHCASSSAHCVSSSLRLTIVAVVTVSHRRHCRHHLDLLALALALALAPAPALALALARTLSEARWILATLAGPL